METQSGTFKVLGFFFRRHRHRVALLVMASLIVGVLEAASVAVVYPILNAAFEGGIGGAGFVLSSFGKIAGLLPVADEFIAFCLLFLILAALTFLVKILFIRYRLRFAGGLVENTQKDIYNKFVRADFQYFAEHKQGELVYNAISAPHSLLNFLNGSTEIISQLILSVSMFVLLFSLSWQGTIVVLVLGLIYFFFTRYLAERVAYDAGKRQAAAISQSTVILNETIDGIKQVKVFNTGADWMRRFGDTVRTHWHHYVRQSTWQQSLHPALILLLYLAIGATAAAIRIIAPDSFGVMIPVFGTFAFAVFRLVPIMGGVSNATMQVKSSLPNCENVYRILSTKLDTIEDGDTELEAFRSRVELDNVTFTYRGRKKVLENVSLAFEKGQTTAIVGRSGSGKTTVVNLLLRLYDVQRGELKIDGVNINRYRIASWLHKIGYVSQDTFIFNDTIRNNITFGATCPEEEIIRVSRYANAHDFITEMPDGYDTVVGDRGMKLSGGQRQRIAVSRAMVRNPEILIFDEATNALDNISEAAVQKAIDTISRDHTVIIIAHRLSTIVNADKIIVLGNGRVLEEGTHRELLEKKGAYRELYQSQPL